MGRFIAFNEIKSLSKLSLLAKQVVEGFIIGLHKSPYHGFSVEFAEHRLYNQGDSMKNVDWKVFARTEKMFTKKYEEETNLRCQIVIDASSSMNFPLDRLQKEERFNKFEYSSLAAAAVMKILQKQRDAFGLTLFDESVKKQTPVKSSNQHYQYLVSLLEDQLASENINVGTNLPKVIHEVSDSIHKRSLVCLFTDLFDFKHTSEELLSALQHLKYNNHEVLLFHTYDSDKELDFNYASKPYIFEDIETGEELKLNPAGLKESYSKAVKSFFDKMKMDCLKYKIDYVPLDINKDIKQVLEAYLLKRTKMR